MQGVAPTIAAQYNQNVNNQQGAAGNLYNAGNTNAGILSGLQQQKLANQGQGVTARAQATMRRTRGQCDLAGGSGAARHSPCRRLGFSRRSAFRLLGLAVNRRARATGTQQMSGAQQFGMIAHGIGSLMPRGPISFGGG
jgi:hypothetical protein